LKDYEKYRKETELLKSRGGILKLLRSTGIDSKVSIPPDYVARRAGTITLYLFGS
jgi:hypothetical protein